MTLCTRRLYNRNKLSRLLQIRSTMTGPPNKRQKREEYRKAQFSLQNGGKLALPKKKFYRQRAHANPFSDHNLT